jgi:hypothetical protein
VKPSLPGVWADVDRLISNDVGLPRRIEPETAFPRWALEEFERRDHVTSHVLEVQDE